jgi:hypothetical protein
MTEDQIDQWKEERDIARAISDDASRGVALQKVYDHRDDMMMECIAHQSDRVKMILKDHDDMVESHKIFCRERAERAGAKKLWDIIKYVLAMLLSGGGGAALMNALSGAD